MTDILRQIAPADSAKADAQHLERDDKEHEAEDGRECAAQAVGHGLGVRRSLACASSAVLQPPPSALISRTLAVIRRVNTLAAVI